MCFKIWISEGLMPSIETSYSQLAHALKDKQSLSIDRKGEWHFNGWFTRFVRWLFDLQDSHLKKISSVVSGLLDRMEPSPLFFNADSVTYARQLKRIKGHLKVAKALSKRIQKKHSTLSSHEFKQLKRKITALRYRVEAMNGGIDLLSPGEIDLEMKERLVVEAENWKRQQKIFTEGDHPLHLLDIEKIEEVCRYPLFAKLLFEDDTLKHKFFSWTLKNCNSVQAFVEYPALCTKLKSIFLAGRIGRFAYANVLTIKKEKLSSKMLASATRKVVRLPFEGKQTNILNEKKYVCLRGGHWVTIKAIFDDLALRNKQPGKFEFVGKNGLCNWSPEKMAYWNPKIQKWVRVNLNSRYWWRALPHLETISKKQVLRRYGLDDIATDQWVLAALATRQKIDSTIEACHGYTEVLIPDKKGSWNVYPFGKFAKKWPENCLEYIGVITDTTRADYIYPDPNIFYSSFRQQAAIPFVVSEEEGLQYMNDRVRNNIRKGREGNLIFMLGYENCAFTPQEDLEAVLGKQCDGGRVPNLFMCSFFESGLSGPTRHFYNLLKYSPRWISAPLQRLMETTLGAWRGINIVDDSGKLVRKSLSTSPFRRGVRLKIDGKMRTVYNYIFHPSHLHRQIIQNKLPEGVIWAGHQRHQ